MKSLATLVSAAAFFGALTGNAAARLTDARINFWDRVAWCEEKSQWHQGGNTFQGGLGIYAPNWDWWAGELGLNRRYPDADDAPRMVQIQVADYGYRVHNGGWGCITNHLI